MQKYHHKNASFEGRRNNLVAHQFCALFSHTQKKTQENNCCTFHAAGCKSAKWFSTMGLNGLNCGGSGWPEEGI